MATKLIVGIGNPDPEYQNTRHNIGFLFLDYLAKKIGANDFELDKKSNALVSKSKIEKTSVVLAKPLSYVNKSGDVVGKLAGSNKLKAKDLIVIQDDLDIEFGYFKNSFDKNSGGHKGIDSIIKAMKTKAFQRVRIGIAVRALQKARQQSAKKRDEFVQDFVLSKFTKKEEETVKAMFKEIYERVLLLLKH